MPTASTQSGLTKRSLILHDLLAFSVLLACTASLFAVTLVLFKSFERQRLILANRWSGVGQQAFAQGRSADAAVALRTSLSYIPATEDTRATQLLLAQALAGSGHVEEASSYFEYLWEAHPGDGFVNLQLARLARRQHDDSKALEYYRASASGAWEDDELERRFAVRLEMIDLLVAQKRLADARKELSGVIANAPNIPSIDLGIAHSMEALGDPAGAAIFYGRASHPDPGSPSRDKEQPDVR